MKSAPHQTHDSDGSSHSDSPIMGGELKGLWRRYLPLARIDILLSSLVVNMLSLALPMLTLQVYDRIIPNNAIETFRYLLLGLIIVLVVETVLKVVRSWLTGWAGARYEHQAGMRSINRLLNSKLETVEGIPAGIHLDRIASIDSVRDFYAGQAALVLVDIPFVFLFLGLIAFIAGPMVLVPIVLLLLSLGIGLWLGKGLRDALGERGTWDDRRYNFIIETLGGIHTVKGLAMEAQMQRRYERLMKSSVDAGHKVALLAATSQSVGGFFSQATLISVAAIGALQVVSGALSIGSLAACTLLAGRTVQPVMRALALWTRYQSVTVAEAKIAEMDSMTYERSGASQKEQLSRLELKDVHFRFTPNMPMVLKGVNMSIECGQMVGIQGDNGSGKSALLHVLMGRLAAEQGGLFINDQPAAGFSLKDVRRQIAYLPQRPVLLQGTVLENLTFFRPKEYLDDALEYAARLGLDEIFARMPEGYDTRVGEASASSLPSGVAQRIVIARALAMNPRFILFDEANSSLDQSGEVFLKKLLEDLRSSLGIVMVTYRPSLLSMADQRFSLIDGQLQTYVPPAGFQPKKLSRPIAALEKGQNDGG